MNHDEPISSQDEKTKPTTEAGAAKKVWKKKRPSFADKPKVVNPNRPDSTASDVRSSEPPKRPGLRHRKVATRKRYPSQDHGLLQDVPGQALEQAKKLNQLPKLEAAARLLKFPGMNTSQAKNEVIQQIRLMADRTGCDKFIFGLSGGLDSAVTVGLLAEALGRNRLQLVHFLESDQPQHDKARAELIAKNLGSPLMIKDCHSQVDQHCQGVSNVTPEMKQALFSRERMITLMLLAEQQDGMVIGSVNKTKWQLGYAVQYGESIGGFNPIGDIYHSQLVELARAINVPKVIIDQALLKPLLPGMTAKSDFTINWKEADLYLHQMLDVRLSLAYIMTLGVDEAKVKYLYQRVRASSRLRQVVEIPAMVSTYESVHVAS